jgi:hypothetical protein
MPFNWSKLIEEHGANKEAIKGLQLWRSAADRDIKALVATKNVIRGGWLTLSIVATVAGAVGAIISRIVWH